MDSARHVIACYLTQELTVQDAIDDMASTHHVIGCRLTQEMTVQNTTADVASTIHQSLHAGAVIYCAFNSSHIPASVELPPPPAGRRWRLVADTALPTPYDFIDADDIPEASRTAAEAMITPLLAGGLLRTSTRPTSHRRSETARL
jgi:hypothetical protein